MERYGAFEVGPFVVRGGTASVWRGVHVDTGLPVAIKRVRADAPAFARVLRREVEAAAALDHPHVVPVLGAGEADDGPWLATPWCPGGSLEDTPPATVAEAQLALEQLLSALAHAHARGIAHLDVKPANLLRRADGSLGLVDFGIARAWRRSVDVVRARSPEFAAPEQVAGRWDAVGPRADLYAVGRLARRWGVDDDWVDACLAGDPAARPSAPAALRALLGDRARAFADWRTTAEADPRVAAAGRSLLLLRDLPVIGRAAARDAAWTVLREVTVGGAPRCLRLVGTPRVGRTRLMRWVAETAQERRGVRVIALRDGAGEEPLAGAARAARVEGVPAARPGRAEAWAALEAGRLSSPDERWAALADLVEALSASGPVIVWPVDAAGWRILGTVSGPVLALSTEVGEEVPVPPPSPGELAAFAEQLGEAPARAADLALAAGGRVETLIRLLAPGAPAGDPLGAWPPGERRALEAAAVLGAALEPSTWAALAARCGVDAEEVAARAAREGLARRDPELRLGADARGAVLAHVADPADRHELVADVLAARGAPAEVAIHRALAGRPDWEALDARLREANDRGDSPTEARLADAWAFAARALPPDDVRRGRGRVHGLRVSIQRRQETFLAEAEALITEARARGWGQVAADALLLWARVRVQEGDREGARRAWTEALALGPATAAAHRIEAAVAQGDGDAARAEAAYLAAAVAYEAEGRPQVARQMRGILVQLCIDRGAWAEAEARLAEVPDGPEQGILRGSLLEARGDRAGAAAAFRAVWDRSVHPHWVGLACVNLGGLALAEGAWADARRWLLDALRALGGLQHPFRHVASAALAVATLQGGDPDGARAWAARAARIPANRRWFEVLDRALPGAAAAPPTPPASATAADTFGWDPPTDEHG